MSKIEEQIEKLEKKLEGLKEKLKREIDKTKWLKIPEKEIEITSKPVHLGKTLSEARKLLNKGEEVASYELLQYLRNSEIYKKCFKKFWVFVYPNPDKISEENGYVARFGAGSDRANLNCNRDADYSNPSLGVFVVRKLI